MFDTKIVSIYDCDPGCLFASFDTMLSAALLAVRANANNLFERKSKPSVILSNS